MGEELQSTLHKRRIRKAREGPGRGYQGDFLSEKEVQEGAGQAETERACDRVK